MLLKLLIIGFQESFCNLQRWVLDCGNVHLKVMITLIFFPSFFKAREKERKKERKKLQCSSPNARFPHFRDSGFLSPWHSEHLWEYGMVLHQP